MINLTLIQTKAKEVIAKAKQAEKDQNASVLDKSLNQFLQSFKQIQSKIGADDEEGFKKVRGSIQWLWVLLLLWEQ